LSALSTIRNFSLRQAAYTNNNKPFRDKAEAMKTAAFSTWRCAKLVLAAALVWSITAGVATAQKASESQVTLAELPLQGQQTYRLIRLGGPFPYDKDGSVFGNRERALPPQKRGYYREYTVKTPGERSRGARRIVCGGPQREPDACYYSQDHYASFRKIVN
jgi:ribonuclease T1